MTTLTIFRPATRARVNWGRWIADCPSPFCLSALALFRDQRLFVCMDCEAEGEVEWPSHPEDIEQILVMRPDPKTRNWEPHETLIDLYAENVLHGILPDAMPWVKASAPALITVGRDRIISSERFVLGGPPIRALER